MKKKIPYLNTKNTIGLVALLLVLAGALAAAFLLPPSIPKPVMPEGIVEIYTNPGGSFTVFWPELPEGYSCRLRMENASGTQEPSCATITPKNQDEPVRLRLSAVAGGKNLLGVQRTAESENYLEITLDLSDAQMLQSSALQSREQEDGTLELAWDGREGVRYDICLTAGDENGVVKSVEGNSASLRFGGDGGLELPKHDETVHIAVRWVEQKEGYTLYGPLSEPVSLTRSSLLSGELALNYTETGERMYTLHWNETKGDYYEVQLWNADSSRWDTVRQVDADGERSYETGRLASGRSCRYQVAAYERASAAAAPKVVAGPEEISFRVSFSPLYATVWPILNQPLYSGAEETSAALAEIAGGTALCVLEEKDGYFYVRYKDLYGYVDSRFCMIDLTEYVGDLCDYNITNSYESVFMVHNYPISQITGEVIKGFENVRKADGSYLVPFLYPSAQKLITAAEAAGEDGYKLKIYEAYRPNEATRFLYDTTLAQLDNPIPDGTGGDAPETSATRSIARSMPEPEAAPPVSAPEDGEPVLPPDVTAGGEDNVEIPGAQSGESPTTEPEPADPEPEPDFLTLGKVMTDGRFRISAFLAASVSNHNRGVALDLTLVDIQTGGELEMQSAIHDLSWYAATYRNNENAKLLEKYMKDIGGMTGLTSEWWHFQDDEIKAELNLTGYLARGVSSEGWKKDDTGWQYRKADGSVYRNTSITVDGKQYSVDGSGYVIG